MNRLKGFFLSGGENLSGDLPGQDGLEGVRARHQRANFELGPKPYRHEPDPCYRGRCSGASAGAVVIESSKLHDG